MSKNYEKINSITKFSMLYVSNIEKYCQMCKLNTFGYNFQIKFPLKHLWLLYEELAIIIDHSICKFWKLVKWNKI